MKRVTRLKLAIVASGRPQKDIAAELGIQESTLSRFANGLHVPVDQRAAIAVALGTTEADLFDESKVVA
jgi:transcriptional regulator with XRE-family HTH domain